ncbi:MAG TPA: hypothetical protein VFH95_12450 [Candidatus Kapabacteria bacterium]|nr:hypothetical protein [Candidatus Kapabacteria bacterium]
MVKHATLLVGIVFFFASCSAPQGPQIKKGSFTYGIITLDTAVSYSLLASSGNAEGFVFDSTGTVKDTLVWPTETLATAYFADVADTTRWQPAGGVTFNGPALPIDSGNAYFYPGAPVYLDGRSQVWNIPGSSSVPAFRDSLQGPFEPVNLSAPSNAANVSEASDLNISWNTGNSSETTLLIVIPSAGGQGYSDEISGSTSSYTIPSASLSEIPKGRATISISRGVYKIGTASNGQSYIMVVWSNDTRDINLQ